MASRFDLGWLRLAAIKIQVALLLQICIRSGHFRYPWPHAIMHSLPAACRLRAAFAQGRGV
jgi:hypothetical protein